MDIEEFNNFLNSETTWRKKEITYFNSLIYKESNYEKEILIKYGILALYSHFEGFYKAAIYKYISLIVSKNLDLTEINLNLLTVIIRKKYELQTNRLFEHDKKLIEALLSNKSLDHFELKEFESIKDLDGNLNDSTLKSILSKIGIDNAELIKSCRKANWLVKTRNQIAHGRNCSIGYTQFIELKIYVEEMITMFSEILSIKSLEFE